jgi:electron transfer flavoprotein alpha subunit
MSGVLVVVEHQNRNGSSALSRISLEALAAGQHLAKQLGVECSAAVLGEGIAPLADEVKAKQLAKVHAVENALLKQYTADGYVHALEQLIRQVAPSFVVFPHTYQVRDFAPALATRFGQVLISDVIAIHPDAEGGPVFVRQLFQGKLNADYRPAASQTSACFISVQAGAFRVDALESGSAPVESFAIELTTAQIRTTPSAPFRESAHTVDLAAAPVIVSVGRGIREQENIALVQALADALGAELAASRPICDAGWVPMERQVGSSGQTVSPKLYLAVGISGAIQHLVGMKGSKAIIAINKDENAPIFEVADYGVAGDLFEIVPALTKAILAAKS